MKFVRGLLCVDVILTESRGTSGLRYGGMQLSRVQGRYPPEEVLSPPRNGRKGIARRHDAVECLAIWDVLLDNSSHNHEHAATVWFTSEKLCEDMVDKGQRSGQSVFRVKCRGALRTTNKDDNSRTEKGDADEGRFTVHELFETRKSMKFASKGKR